MKKIIVSLGLVSLFFTALNGQIYNADRSWGEWVSDRLNPYHSRYSSRPGLNGYVAAGASYTTRDEEGYGDKLYGLHVGPEHLALAGGAYLLYNWWKGPLNGARKNIKSAQSSIAKALATIEREKIAATIKDKYGEKTIIEHLKEINKLLTEIHTLIPDKK